MCPGHKDLRSLGGIFYLQDIQFDPLCGAEHLCLHLFVLCQDGICLAQIDAVVSAQASLYDTCHNIFFLSVILVEDHFSLFFTDFLQNYVLGILGGDPSELLGLDLHIHHISQLILGIHHLGICQADLHDRVHHFLHHSLLRVHAEITGLGVDIYVHIVSLAEMVLARLDQGLLNGFQKRIFADGFLFFQNIQRL